MSLYASYLQEIESRKEQGLHPKPIDGGELAKEIISQIKNIDSERAWDALQAAQLADLVAHLPMGIFTNIGDNGIRFSGGQRQRVAVARSIFQSPSAILADEPVSSVDPARARSLVELLLKVADEEKTTLIMSLHNLELAMEKFPRVVGMRNGSVQFDRSPDQI